MKKRDRLEIIHDILSVVQKRGERVKPTHILYKSNLSHQMLQTYLKELEDGGFLVIEQDKKGKRFLLTEKAYKYMQDYGMIQSFLESYGLD